MDESRYIGKHVVNLPKSGIRDFFDIVAKMKDASLPGFGFSKPTAANGRFSPAQSATAKSMGPKRSK